MYEKEILNFCNNIYCLRKNNHFSKAEMCRRIKVSIKTLSMLGKCKLYVNFKVCREIYSRQT